MNGETKGCSDYTVSWHEAEQSKNYPVTNAMTGNPTDELAETDPYENEG